MTLRKMRRLFDVQDADQNDTDQIGLCWTPQVGNCSGVTNWIELGQPEIDLIKRLNPGDSVATLEEKIHWAVWERIGGLYYAADRTRPPWRWPSIVMGSKSDRAGEFNQVNVLAVERGYHKIETIPILPNYDHIRLATHPHLIHRVYVTNVRGITYDTPKGAFYMPIFSPINRRHARGNVSGMWLRGKYVGDIVTTVEPPPVEPPAEPPPFVYPYAIEVLRRSVVRQRPNASSAKIEPVAEPGWLCLVYAEINGWGDIGGGQKWIWLQDTRRL
jgi:hypothetical protein